MNSTAYSRMPLAHPTAAASATSCRVSNDSSAGSVIGGVSRSATSWVAQCVGDPARRALVEERRDAFLALRRAAHSGDPGGGIGDHGVVEGPRADGTNERLRFRLRARPGHEQRAQELVDAPVELFERTDVVDEPDTERFGRRELL